MRCDRNFGAMGTRILALFAATLVACGPIGYVSNVRSASTAVEEARAVNAAKYAPYEWTRAVEYLHAARAEAAMADFEAANRFGRLATEAATKAKVDAIRRAGDPRAMDEITPPPGAGSTPARGDGGLAPAVDPDVTIDEETPSELNAP